MFEMVGLNDWWNIDAVSNLLRLVTFILRLNVPWMEELAITEEDVQ